MMMMVILNLEDFIEDQKTMTPDRVAALRFLKIM